MTESPAAAPNPEHSDAGQHRWPALLRLVAALMALLVIGAAILLLRGRGNPRSASLATNGGPLDTRTPVVGQPAPNFALPDTNGRLVRLSDLRGQVVLVNFWATWCGPCRAELPDITQVYREQHDQGFAVLEVNEQESLGDITTFASQIGSMPPVILDKDGAVMAQYRLKGLPDSFVVDRQGVVRAVSYGPISRQTIMKYIDDARAATS